MLELLFISVTVSCISFHAVNVKHFNRIFCSRLHTQQFACASFPMCWKVIALYLRGKFIKICFFLFVYLFMGIYVFLLTCLTDTWKLCIKVVHMCRLNYYVRIRKLIWSEKTWKQKIFHKRKWNFSKTQLSGQANEPIDCRIFLSYSKLVIIELMNSN